MELTPLGQRLARAAQAPGVEWRILAENIPVWPSPPPAPPDESTGADAQYAPSQGVEVLLDALRRREQARGIGIGTESILVTNGAFDALGLAARQLHGLGVRRAICAGPVLHSVASLFEVIGFEVVVTDWARLVGEQSWQSPPLGREDLLYLNSPHNPTGNCLDEPVTRALLKEQQRRGFALIFDLVYDSFVYDPAVAVSPLALVEDWDRVYGVNSFSKNYGAPGLRTGWMVAEPGTVEQVTARLEMERIAVATGAQLRAASLCAYGNAPLVERAGQGRRLVLDWAAENGIAVSPPLGGTQAWLDLGVGDSERLADRLMRQERLVIATGANYYPMDAGYIRIPTGMDPVFLAESLELIARTRHQMRGPAR